MTPEPEVARILVVDADPALHGLLEQWLAEEACRVFQDNPDPVPHLIPHLILIDMHRPRQGGAEIVKRLGARYRGTPLVALSSNFFTGVEANGPVARALGVDAVLPKPLTREALLRTLRRLLPQLE